MAGYKSELLVPPPGLQELLEEILQESTYLRHGMATLSYIAIRLWQQGESPDLETVLARYHQDSEEQWRRSQSTDQRTSPQDRAAARSNVIEQMEPLSADVLVDELWDDR